jgi:hypothetical protein
MRKSDEEERSWPVVDRGRKEGGPGFQLVRCRLLRGSSPGIEHLYPGLYDRLLA